jgi:hypothetical protein
VLQNKETNLPGTGGKATVLFLFNKRQTGDGRYIYISCRGKFQQPLREKAGFVVMASLFLSTRLTI